MSERDPHMQKLQAMVTALVQHRVAASLEDLERALGSWRSGAASVLETHGEVLAHAARCERTVENITTMMAKAPDRIGRDAVDYGTLTPTEFVALFGKPHQDVEPAGCDAEPDRPSRNKRASVEELLERGPVLIHLDARKPGVEVPQQFRGDARLVLRFGYRLHPPIADMMVDEDGVRGTLTFGGRPFTCLLPWDAVYAAVVEGEHRGAVWPEDIPDEVIDREKSGGGGAPDGELLPLASGPNATIAPATTPAAGRSRSETKDPAKRAHLRLVD